MIASPEGHPSKLPPKAPFENQSGSPSRKPFRRLRRSPCRTALRRVPPVPEVSPEAIPRKPLSARLRTKPFGPSFGTRHVSRRLSRKTLPKMTYVPEALPRIPPEAFFETPSEPATCSRVPSETPHLPDSSRAATCPRILRTGRISPGCRPSLPSVSECRAKTLPPGALRAATCPETPEYLPEARMRCVPECRVNFPRMPPVAPRAPSAPEPQTTRTPPGSPRITPEAPPGHSASAPRVDHPGSEFSVIYRKFQKMDVTSKIHRNSSLNRKNPKPIFTVSF